MPVAPKAALGTGLATASGTTIVITTTAAIDIGDLVVVRWASDNLNATTPTATCADGGNTYTVLRQGAVNATAAAGVAGGMLASKATVARPSGSTITVTLSGAVAHKCAIAESFTGVENTTRVAAVGATGTVAAASAGATAAGVLAGDLVLGHIANETRGTITGDSDTTNGAWSTQISHRSATSGSDATCVSVAGQHKIPTAGGAQTYNVTAVAAEWLCQCVVLQATPDPTLTQAAYRFYDQGTESGSVALQPQDTAHTGNLTSGDGLGQLRIRVQSTTAVAIPFTDDWQLQYERNTSGTWVNVTDATSHVRGYNDPSLTDAAATTSRLTGGTGTFVTGKISEFGLVNDIGGWSGNNYTELLYSLQFVAANLNDGDTLRFRVLRNGSTFGLTYTQTPLVTILRPSTGAAFGTVHDWTASASGTKTQRGSATSAHTWTATATGEAPVAGGAVPPVYVSVTTNVGDQVTLPSPIEAGDLLLVWCLIYDHTTLPTIAITGVSGFDPVASVQSPTLDYQSAFLFRKVAVGTEDGTAIGRSGSSNYTVWITARITGVSTSAPIDVFATQAAFNNSPAPAIPSLTTTGGERLLVAFKGGYNDPATVDPAGWTARVSDFDSVNDFWTKTQSVAGASGSTPWTQAGSSYTVIAAALTPVPAAGGPPEGSATVAWTETTSGTGKRVPKASADTVWAETQTAAGKKIPKSTSTATWDETLTAAGKRIQKGTSTLAWAEVQTAAGKRTPKATTTTAHAWTTSAAGVKPVVGVKQGTAAVTYTETITAAGVKPVVPVKQGSAAVTWAETQTAAGKRTPKGSTVAAFTEAVTSTGKRTPKSPAAVTHAWALTVAGVKPVVGAKTGTAAFVHNWVTTGAGRRVQRGSAAVAHTWASAATGANGTWSPAAIAGLGVWFDASQLGLADGAAVTVWPDLSGAGRNLAQGQGTVPHLKTNVLNGLPVVRFDGIDNVLQGTAPANYLHVFILAKYNLAVFDDYDGLLTGTTGEWVLIGYSGGVGWYPFSGAATYHYNGVLDAASNRPGPMGVWGHFNISHPTGWTNMTPILGLDRNYPPRYWDGDVAEIAVYDRVLTGPERVQVENYLQAKWFPPPKQGSATASWSTSGTATGKRTPKATSAVTYTEAPAVVGKRVPKGSSVITHAWTTTATGKKVLRGTATVAHQWQPSAAGKRVTKSAVLVAHTWALSADGRYAARATSAVSFQFVLVRAEGVNEFGNIEGAWNGQAFDLMQYEGTKVVEYLMVPA